MTLRLPNDVHARVSALAEADHISLNAALVQAAELWATERARGQIVAYAVDDVMARRSELLARLRDA
ncbi:HicB-like protein involved in pilus formation [Nocardia tenerifensis]|uniref:HicB-like protein involved in pilus formation n=1 Tax=Nocardia tenerifensis TaxID=228006 RepID=A0A318K4Q5_9NOCA|nr:HicB-like protein involved in pilus formation [Nocardia tenerifensis]